MKKQMLAIGLMWLGACSGPYQLAKHSESNIKVNADSLQLYDTAIANMIAPYKLKLDAQMNELIGEAENTLTKELPDGALGNFVADACLWYAQNNINAQADFCVLNSGGVRIPNIQKGDITVGKIYELMPFDNLIEVVELDGKACKELFTWIAKWKGAPVSGIELTIDKGEATNITINGQDFNESKTYLVATTDYVANGGDNATMFAKGKRSNNNYKLRDALIDYVKNKQTIKANNNGRIKQN